MAFTLDDVVLWGRPFDEYCDMFALTDEDLQLRILGCGDGPAGFNATLTAAGGDVVSVDPIYQFSAEEIHSRIDESARLVMHQTSQHVHEFVWNRFASLAHLEQVRRQAMAIFLADYPTGLAEGRYLEGALPALPLPDNHFDLALCSHFLFLYSQHFSLDFHVASIRELCRVAAEVRIFPLLELGSVRSRHLDAVVDQLHAIGYQAVCVPVPYEFQRGGNEMLVIRQARRQAAP